jgi:ribonuclease HI
MGKFWGPNPNMTKWIYTNIVRPTFTYGCIAWGKTTRTKDFQNKAKRLQRLALCDIGPIRTHSPTSGIEIFTNTMPLDIYIKGEFIAAHNRIKNVITTIAGTTDTIASHYAWARKLRDESGLNNIPSDFTASFFHGHKLYSCSREEYITLNETRPNKLQIFTDGSRIGNQENGHAGCGFVIYGADSTMNNADSNILHEQSTYLGTMATVFQAEIYAIGQAALHIINHPNLLTNGIEQIDIITDSKSALCALDRINTNSKLVKDCMEMLDKLQVKVNLAIHWIKAHVGHVGNEKADQLAKLGTQKLSYHVEPIIPVSLTWIKSKIRTYLYKEWTLRWQSLSEARQTKIFFPTPNPKISKQLLAYDKPTCGKLFRWISGHSFHRYHNHLTNPTEFSDPKCRTCGQDKEETNHLFAYCTSLAQPRMKICGLPTLPEPFVWTPPNLLSMISEIERISPEEGQLNTGQIDNDIMTNNNNINTMAE